MWVLPCATTNPSFTSILTVGAFQLMEYKPSFSKRATSTFNGLAGLLRVAGAGPSYTPPESVLDQNPKKYRIVLSRDDHMLLAVSDSKENIDKHWEFVTSTLHPMMEAIDDKEDSAKFVLNKVSSLAQLEEGEVGKNEARREKFREEFPELEGEKFVTYYDGALWETGKYTPITGTIYLLEESLAFHSLPNFKLIVQFYDVSSITKEKTVGFAPSVKLAVKGKEYWFIVYERDSLFQAMELLWSDAMKKWQRTLDPEGVGRDAAQDTISTNMVQVEENTKMHSFQTQFRVPEGPLDESKEGFWAQLWRDDRSIIGLFYFTENFVCFRSSRGGVRCVIAFINIIAIEPIERPNTETKTAIKIATESSNEFEFCLLPESRDTIMSRLITLWNSRLYYRKKQLGKTTRDFVSHNGWSMDDAYMEAPGYREDQDRRKKIWDAYFQRYGFISEPIVSVNFNDMVKTEGIPDVYRGRLWQICSGSIHKLETQPAYYASLLARKDGTTEKVLDEIERDVTRSLPHHPFYKQEEGRDQLRNVLVSYSKRSPHIGYCQAMNIVVATALLYMSEEEAFWLIATICEDIIPEHYTKGLQLMGSIVDQQVFTEFAKSHFPEVCEHLEEIGTPIDMLVLPWFMTFFIGYIPWRASLRVLDIVHVLGADVLFPIGLAVLSLTVDQFLALEEGMNVTKILRQLDLDPEELIRVAFSRFANITSEKIEAQKKAHKVKMMQSIEEANKIKLLDEIAKSHPNIRVAELNTIFKEYQKLAVKKTPSKAHDTTGKHDCIDLAQFRQLIYHHIPYLETETDKNEPILKLLFKMTAKSQLMTFEEFINVLSVIWRGTLQKKFNLCFDLLHSRTDKLTKPQFRTVLDILYRISFAGSTEWEHNSLRLDMFVDIVFESIKGHHENLEYSQFSEMILESNVLDDFWAQLYKGM